MLVKRQCWLGKSVWLRLWKESSSHLSLRFLRIIDSMFCENRRWFVFTFIKGYDISPKTELHQQIRNYADKVIGYIIFVNDYQPVMVLSKKLRFSGVCLHQSGVHPFLKGLRYNGNRNRKEIQVFESRNIMNAPTLDVSATTHERGTFYIILAYWKCPCWWWLSFRLHIWSVDTPP